MVPAMLSMPMIMDREIIWAAWLAQFREIAWDAQFGSMIMYKEIVWPALEGREIIRPTWDVQFSTMIMFREIVWLAWGAQLWENLPLFRKII